MEGGGEGVEVELEVGAIDGGCEHVSRWMKALWG